MKGMWTIFRKELARFFGDKRMVVTSLILPGLLIYVLYSFMGSAIMGGTDESQLLSVGLNDVPLAMEQALATSCNLAFVADAQEAQSLVTDEAIDIAVIFPNDFDVAVAAYETGKGIAPSVELYYNSASESSQTAMSMLTMLLEDYETTLANKFDVSMQDLASDEDTTTQIFAMMLPTLLMSFLYSGCVAVAPESIAGEKERGTIATLLITPVGRNEIALGKILALSLISVLSGASSAVGTILSLPKLMGTDFSASPYTASDYALLALVILSTVLLLVTAISLISAFAKSTKEAQMMATPLMVVSMFMGIMAMTGSGAASENALYLLPLYNSAQSMLGIFSMGEVGIPVLLTVLSNLAFTAVGIFMLTKIFRSEKMMSV